ncbi:hypothetical protein Tco_1064405 [Tanacetum coccineum]
MEMMNVTFDELSAMAFEQSSSKPGLQSMASGQISSGLDLIYASSTITSQKPTERDLDILFEATMMIILVVNRQLLQELLLQIRIFRLQMHLQQLKNLHRYRHRQIHIHNLKIFQM